MLRLVLSLLFCLIAGDALACSCAGPGRPAEAFQQAKAVFSARVTVTGKSDQGFPTGYLITPSKVWKGDPGKSIDYGLPHHGCAYWNFEDGKDYLIYALPSWDKEKPDQLELTMCSRTKLLEKSQIETRYFDGDAKAVDASLPELLQSGENAEMRAEAANLLGEMLMMTPFDAPVPAATAKALEAATTDKSPVVRLAATRNFGTYRFAGKPESKTAMLALLKDEDREVRDAAMGGLSTVAKRNSASFRALADALKASESSPWPDIKRQESLLWGYSRALAETAETDAEKDEVVGLLLGLMEKINDPYSKVGAIQHLGFQGQRAHKAAPRLLAILKGTDSYHLKQYTLLALGDIKAVEAQAEIEKYMDDENCYVAESAVQAVHKMNPSGFAEFFRDKGMPMMKSRFDKCSSEFIFSLQSIGPDAREIEPFLQEKYDAMDEGDWKKGSLKTLLETWKNAEKPSDTAP